MTIGTPLSRPRPLCRVGPKRPVRGHPDAEPGQPFDELSRKRNEDFQRQEIEALAKKAETIKVRTFVC
jgi:hypothetical protein